jgi:hypothetical protein
LKTTDTKLLEAFLSVLNRKIISRELYNNLLKAWDLSKVDLDEELVKINSKKSNLSKSRRDAVPVFIKLRDALTAKENEAKNALDAKAESEEKTLAEDQIVL